MQEFLKKNTWNLIVTGIAVILAWANLNSRVNVMAQEHENLDKRLVEIQVLTERVIRLEEARQTSAEDIKEIKEDIKDIKAHFEIK